MWLLGMGSPVHLDTISVGPHETYDVAYGADVVRRGLAPQLRRGQYA